MGGAAGGFLGPDDLDVPLTFEGTREAGTTLGSGVVLVLDETVDLPRFLMRIAAFFRDESCGQCVPCRVGTVRQEEALARLVAGRAAGRRRGRAGAHRRGRPVHARRVDLRSRPDGLERGRVGDPQAPRLPGRDGVTELLAPRRMVELEVDGQAVRVFEGATILDACTQLGIDTPTLCYGETLQPANVCRVCVVELEGSRVLVPACSRRAEAGMKVQTDSERVRLLAEGRAGAARLVGRPLDDGRRARLPRAVRRRAGALRAARAAGARPRPGADRASRRARRPHRGDRPPAGQGRQRALRARLRQVHPLLQVRRRLRRAVPEHVRHPRRRPRLRRADLDRARHASCPSRPASTAATASRCARPGR